MAQGRPFTSGGFSYCIYTLTPGRNLNVQWPPLEVRSQKQEACHLSPCHQTQVGQEDFSIILLWVLLEMVHLESRKAELWTLARGGTKPRGKDARSESEQGHRAPVEEGWSGQEQGLPPKGPSPQPPARVWQCTPGPCHASIHMEVLKAATPGAVTVWARDSGRKDPEKGGQQPLGPLQDALSPAQPSGR